ncbi:MAG: hypothetical protein GY814_01775 [Gammaproteobacteria bacterium]|nr:hypothetical protein [Gammaproteobacteria bacterium]
MAIDSRAKRASIACLGLAFLGPSITIDGSLSQADRQVVAHSYYGILATEGTKTIGGTSQLEAFDAAGGIKVQKQGTLGGVSQLEAFDAAGGITVERTIGGTTVAELEVIPDFNTLEVQGRGLLAEESGDGTIINLATLTEFEVLTEPVTLVLDDNSLVIEVPDDTQSVQTIGFVGPAGAAGADGADATSSEVIVLNKAERKNVVEDSPSTGDITVYYGIANPLSDDADPVWLITQTVYLADGDSFDAIKLFASDAQDQVWNDHLTLVYF